MWKIVKRQPHNEMRRLRSYRTTFLRAESSTSTTTRKSLSLTTAAAADPLLVKGEVVQEQQGEVSRQSLDTAGNNSSVRPFRHHHRHYIVQVQRRNLSTFSKTQTLLPWQSSPQSLTSRLPLLLPPKVSLSHEESNSTADAAADASTLNKSKSENSKAAVKALMGTLLQTQRLVRSEWTDSTTISTTTMSTTTNWVLPIEKSFDQAYEDDDDNSKAPNDNELQLGLETRLSTTTSTLDGMLAEFDQDKEDPSSLNKENVDEDESTTTSSSFSTTEVSQQQQQFRVDVEKLQERFLNAAKNKEKQQSFQLFHYAHKLGVADQLDQQALTGLFRIACSRRDPFTAYLVLQECLKWCPLDQDPQTREQHYRLMTQMCDSLRYLDPAVQKPFSINTLARTVIKQARALPKEGRERCLIALLPALVEQRLVTLGKLARLLYDEMVNEMDLKPTFFQYLLSLSKYNRQGDLPYAEILLKVVSNGIRPAPSTLMNAVNNFFPFDNMQEMNMVLASLIELQSQESNDGFVYNLYIATLEIIAATASGTGALDTIQLVWDYLIAAEVDPSVGIYESTAVAFIQHPDRYRNAFAVLEEMETMKCTPSRALISSLSFYIRHETRNIDTAYNVFMDEIDAWYNARDGSAAKGDELQTATGAQQKARPKPFPLAALNVVLSAAAGRGESDLVIRLMTLVEESRFPVDSDTFAFALEALGKHVAFAPNRPRQQDDSKLLSGYVMDKAVAFLTMMEERDIVPSHHVIREYVELLCSAEDIVTANQVVREALQSKAVSNKTLYRVAIKNAQLGNYDRAREFASMGTEPMPFLLRRIDSIEQGRVLFH